MSVFLTKNLYHLFSEGESYSVFVSSTKLFNSIFELMPRLLSASGQVKMAARIDHSFAAILSYF